MSWHNLGVDETETLMHRAGTVFAAGLTQPGSLHEVLMATSRQGRSYDAAGNSAMIGRWGKDLAALIDEIRLREGIRVLTVEMSADLSGCYLVACSGDLPTQTGLIASEPSCCF